MHKFFFVAVAWTILITFLSLTDSKFNAPESLLTIKNKDKVVHFIFYFVFVFLWFRSINKITNKKIIIIVGIAIVYGIIIEVLQGTLTLNRQPDIYDAAANSLGAITSAVIFKNKKN